MSDSLGPGNPSLTLSPAGRVRLSPACPKAVANPVPNRTQPSPKQLRPWRRPGSPQLCSARCCSLARRPCRFFSSRADGDVGLDGAGVNIRRGRPFFRPKLSVSDLHLLWHMRHFQSCGFRLLWVPGAIGQKYLAHCNA